MISLRLPLNSTEKEGIEEVNDIKRLKNAIKGN
jgi:hypothetical protein